MIHTTLYFYDEKGRLLRKTITDANGDTVARYRYDAWGKCTIVSDTSTDGIAAVNPYRYRTYYFDSETGLYYLQSRYYDPETGRFINADDARYMGDSETALGYNLFAYCENNPVIYGDYDGHDAIILIYRDRLQPLHIDRIIQTKYSKRSPNRPPVP